MMNSPEHNSIASTDDEQMGCYVFFLVQLLRICMIAFYMWICYEGRLIRLWAEFCPDTQCDPAANIHALAMIILGCLFWKKLPAYLAMVHEENGRSSWILTQVFIGVLLFIPLCFLLAGIPVWLLMEHTSLALCMAVIIFWMPGFF